MKKEEYFRMDKIDPEELCRQLRKPFGEQGKLVGEKMNVSNNSIYALMFSKIEFNDNDNILEIGFGNGKFFKRYFEKARNIKVSGIDISDVMLEEASIINKGLIESNKLFIYCESCQKMSFPDGSFDKIISLNTIYFWEQRDAQLEEIKRVLKRNGKLVIGFRPKSIMEKLAFINNSFNLFESNEIAKLLEKHNFKNIREFMQNISRKTVDGSDIDSIDICISGEKQE